MHRSLLILMIAVPGFAHAEDSSLDLMLGLKAGTYQTSGNLFRERQLAGWGLTMKLIPSDFGQEGSDNSWIGGLGFLLSLDLDNLTGKTVERSRFPFSAEAELHLSWNVLAVYVCGLTHFAAQACLGLPFSNSLYLEQNVAGESFNSFSMGNSNPPVFFNLISHQRPIDFGLQISSAYWSPTFAGVKTHFNLIQSQLFLGYAF